MFSFLLHTLLFLTTAVLASPISQTASLPPSQDPWYRAPREYESALPGQVLKVRHAPGNLTQAYGNSSAAYNILYRTVNSNYQPAWAVTTLFVPTTIAHHGSAALLSYHIPYNSPNLDSSPSYTLSSPAYSTQIVGKDIAAALGRGWLVSVPDFEGSQAAFGCAVQEGLTTLDSARAVLNFAGENLKALFDAKSARVALWGYSGASITSEYAGELQAHYAPELRMAGVAVGGVVSNLTDALVLSNKGAFVGFVPLVFVGLSQGDAAFSDALHAGLKKSGLYNATTFLSTKNMSSNDAFAFFANQDIWSYFVAGADFLQQPVVRQTLATNGIMGSQGGIPSTTPLYMYKAVHDEVTPIGDTDALFRQYCSPSFEGSGRSGANIVYQRNSVGGHLAEETNGDADAFQWLVGVLEGTYLHQGCTVRNVSIAIDDSPV